MDKPDFQTVLGLCNRFLTHHPRKTPRQVFIELAEFTPQDLQADVYGVGKVINNFEAEVAELLGKPAAVFMPSGTMAQQIALRIWSQRKGTVNMVWHPRCHLEIHEEKGYQKLHGLHGILAGHPDRPMVLADLQMISEPLAVLLLELPQREIGGHLPGWHELIEMIDWAHARGAAVHLDGARLWECKPFYGRDYKDIAAPFDTIYVSFYKILDGISGSILAGPQDFIAEARIWQRRHGGKLLSLYPYVLSAQKGLHEHLDKMGLYHETAMQISQTLSEFDEIILAPNPPHTNMMHIYLQGKRERLEQAAIDIAREQGIFLFFSLRPSLLPNYSVFEFVVGDNTLKFTQDEIRKCFQDLFDRTQS